MAKLGTIDHPKTLALADALDIPQAYAYGILCAIWEFTGRYAPDGALGRFGDRVIAVNAAKCDVKPAVLIAALVECRWLDEVEGEAEPGKPARLYVHDWHDHCENWVRAKLEKDGKGFYVGGAAVKRTRGRPPKKHHEPEENPSENQLENDFPPVIHPPENTPKNELNLNKMREKTPVKSAENRAPTGARVAMPSHAMPSHAQPSLSKPSEANSGDSQANKFGPGPPTAGNLALKPEANPDPNPVLELIQGGDGRKRTGGVALGNRPPAVNNLGETAEQEAERKRSAILAAKRERGS
jgi:hypothetical protein